MATTARVQITIDVQATSNWTDETTVAQIRKQAVDGVRGMLGKIEQCYDLKLVDEPRVTATTTENI